MDPIVAQRVRSYDNEESLVHWYVLLMQKPRPQPASGDWDMLLSEAMAQMKIKVTISFFLFSTMHIFVYFHNMTTLVSFLTLTPMCTICVPFNFICIMTIHYKYYMWCIFLTRVLSRSIQTVCIVEAYNGILFDHLSFTA